MAERISVLHNVSNRCHRTDEKGVHMPVGDILKVEGLQVF